MGPDGGAVTIAVTAIPSAFAEDPSDPEIFRVAFEPFKEAMEGLLLPTPERWEAEVAQGAVAGSLSGRFSAVPVW